MAITSRFPVDPGTAFPHGLYAFKDTEVQPVRNFKESKKDKFVQEMDDASGLPVWTLEVLDADPEARKNAAITVKIASQHQPMLPDVPAGWPVRPVEFEGLTATAWLDNSRCKPPREGESHRCSARIAWSFRARGIKLPQSSGKPSASKSATDKAAA